MAALSTALNIARSSLATVSGQTAIASRNIANVGNADYSRKTCCCHFPGRRRRRNFRLHPRRRQASVRQNACRFLEFRGKQLGSGWHQAAQRNCRRSGVGLFTGWHDWQIPDGIAGLRAKPGGSDPGPECGSIGWRSCPLPEHRHQHHPGCAQAGGCGNGGCGGPHQQSLAAVQNCQ